MRRLGLLPVLIALVAACGSEQEPGVEMCETEGASTVVIAEARFDLSSRLLGVRVYSPDKPNTISPDVEQPSERLCPNADGLVLTASQLEIHTPPRRQLTADHFDVSIQLRIFPQSDGAKDLSLTRDWTKFEMQDAGNGFISSRNGSVGMGAADIFLQDSPTMFTLMGNPVAFSCYYDSEPRGRRCFTWWLGHSGEQYEYSFFDGEYPRSEWLNLHQQVLDGIAELKS